jgi:hypothetical protein
MTAPQAEIVESRGTEPLVHRRPGIGRQTPGRAGPVNRQGRRDSDDPGGRLQRAPAIRATRRRRLTPCNNAFFTCLTTSNSPMRLSTILRTHKACKVCKVWEAHAMLAGHRCRRATIDARLSPRELESTMANRSPSPMLHSFPHQNLVWSMWNMWNMAVTFGLRRLSIGSGGPEPFPSETMSPGGAGSRDGRRAGRASQGERGSLRLTVGDSSVRRIE